MAQDVFDRIGQAAKVLNDAADKTMVRVKDIETKLGWVYAGLPVEGPEIMEEARLGYHRIGSNWRVCVCIGKKILPLSDCSQKARIAAAPHLDALLEAIAVNLEAAQKEVL